MIGTEIDMKDKSRTYAIAYFIIFGGTPVEICSSIECTDSKTPHMAEHHHELNRPVCGKSIKIEMTVRDTGILIWVGDRGDRR